MIRSLLRLFALLACALIILQAFRLWDATGRGGFTRYHDAARAEREAQQEGGGLADLFEDTGLEEETGSLEVTPNRFTLGLLPSAYPWAVWDRHFVSVATVAGPAAFVGLITLAAGGRRKGRRS